MKGTRGLVVASALALLAAQASTLAAESPGKLRAEMTRAEKEFIDLYNKVNANPEFAIACRLETPTGSNFAVRICQPKYIVTANARATGERMHSAVTAAVNTGAANSKGPNVGAGLGAGGGSIDEAKEEAFRQNMLDVLQKNPELQALGNKRDDLQARYDEATKRKNSR
jgi:hypothetical protein